MERSSIERRGHAQSPPIRTFLCKYCKNVFYTRKEFLAHKEEEHLEETRASIKRKGEEVVENYGQENKDSDNTGQSHIKETTHIYPEDINGACKKIKTESEYCAFPQIKFTFKFTSQS